MHQELQPDWFSKPVGEDAVKWKRLECSLTMCLKWGCRGWCYLNRPVILLQLITDCGQTSEASSLGLGFYTSPPPPRGPALTLTQLTVMESLYQSGYAKCFSHTNAFSVASQDPACDLQGTAKSLTCPRLPFGCLSLVRGKIFNLEPVPVHHCRPAVVHAQCLLQGTDVFSSAAWAAPPPILPQDINSGSVPQSPVVSVRAHSSLRSLTAMYFSARLKLRLFSKGFLN